MKSAFVCWRPFQIMNTVNFVMHNMHNSAVKADLYLMDIPTVARYYEQIKKENLFQNVYLYRDYSPKVTIWDWIKDRIIKIVDTIFPKFAIKRRLLNEPQHSLMDYDNVFASGWDKFFVGMVEINPKATVYMLDDGTGSYSGDFRERELVSSYKLLNKVLGKGALSIQVKGLYLDRKELMAQEPGYPVYQMPELTDEIFEVLKRVFDYKDSECYKGKKYIYLTDGIDDIGGKPVNCTEAEIARHLQVVKNKVCARLHPYQKAKDIGLPQDTERQMWELVCQNNIHNDSVLIAIYSTAQITPKMLYDKEPILIFLYKIFYEEAECKRIDQFVNHLSQYYSNAIYQPETLEEFDELLNKLENENNEEI